MTLAQLVSHDRADRCDVRRLRSRQAGDHIHADDRDLQQAAAQMTDERVDELDQTQADAAALHDESSENEEGNRQQNVIPCPVHHVLRQHHERGRAAAPEIGGRRQQQDEPDGDARENGDHEKDESRDDRLRRRRRRAATARTSRQPRRPPRRMPPKSGAPPCHASAKGDPRHRLLSAPSPAEEGSRSTMPEVAGSGFVRSS